MGIHEELERMGCEALLVVAPSARDVDLAPFVGAVHLHSAFLILRRGESPPYLGFLSPMERDEAASTGCVLLPPEALDVGRLAREGLSEEALLTEVVANGLALAKVATGSIAIAGHPAAGLTHALGQRLEQIGWTLVSGHGLLQLERKRKSAVQIAEIRRVSGGVCDAFRGVAALLARTSIVDGDLWFEGERLRVGRLRSEITSRLARHGLDQPEGNIVAPGADGGIPHTAGDDVTVLRAGDSLVVDLYPRGRLFSDCTRTFCVGRPSEALVRAHGVVLEALQAAHDLCRPGVRAWDLQVETCEYLKAAGYPTPLHDPGTERGYVHGLGHGVGYELHELPSFREVEGREGRLEEGDVLTLEPGLYEPEPADGLGFGVRLEDTVAIRAGGIEKLTALPYSLDPRSWTAES